MKCGLEFADWTRHRELIGLYFELTGERFNLSGHAENNRSIGRAMSALERGLESGRLCFEVQPRPSAAPAAAEDPLPITNDRTWRVERPQTPSELAGAAKRRLTEEDEPDWIEFELVDQRDQFVPGRKYSLLLSDGTTKSGSPSPSSSCTTVGCG